MSVVRTSKVDLHVNGDGAYAFVAQPDDDAQHPGLVLIQEWYGIEPHILDLAHKLAAQGFVVAVPDLYHGKVATEPNDAMRMVMMVRGNVDKAANEIIGALETVKAMPNVEPKKLGLIGFLHWRFHDLYRRVTLCGSRRSRPVLRFRLRPNT